MRSARHDVGRVALLGFGRVGSVLARGLVEAGWDVGVATSRPGERIAPLVDALAPGAQALDAARAVADAAVVVLALPLHRLPELDPALLAGRVVVDITNHWEPVDGPLPAFAREPGGTSAAVQRIFPDAVVVKALNHLGYHEIESDRRPPGASGRRAVAVAGDDSAAVGRVAAMVDRLGFDPVALGSLEQGRILEAGGPVFGARLDAEGMRRALRLAAPPRSG